MILYLQRSFSGDPDAMQLAKDMILRYNLKVTARIYQHAESEWMFLKVSLKNCRKNETWEKTKYRKGLIFLFSQAGMLFKLSKSLRRLVATHLAGIFNTPPSEGLLQALALQYQRPLLFRIGLGTWQVEIDLIDLTGWKKLQIHFTWRDFHMFRPAQSGFYFTKK